MVFRHIPSSGFHSAEGAGGLKMRLMGPIGQFKPTPGPTQKSTAVPDPQEAGAPPPRHKPHHRSSRWGKRPRRQKRGQGQAQPWPIAGLVYPEVVNRRKAHQPGTDFQLHQQYPMVETGYRSQPQSSWLGKIRKQSQPQTCTCKQSK